MTTTTKTYDPNCVSCRYSKPGASGDHRQHQRDTNADVTEHEDGTLSIVGKDTTTTLKPGDHVELSHWPHQGRVYRIVQVDGSNLDLVDVNGGSWVSTHTRYASRLFGKAGENQWWALRSDRPSHHREDCDCRLCWRIVPA